MQIVGEPDNRQIRPIEHARRALGALIVALVLFAFALFQGRVPGRSWAMDALPLSTSPTRGGFGGRERKHDPGEMMARIVAALRTGLVLGFWATSITRRAASTSIRRRPRFACRCAQDARRWSDRSDLWEQGSLADGRACSWRYAIGLAVERLAACRRLTPSYRTQLPSSGPERRGVSSGDVPAAFRGPARCDYLSERHAIRPMWRSSAWRDADGSP